MAIQQISNVQQVHRSIQATAARALRNTTTDEPSVVPLGPAQRHEPGPVPAGVTRPGTSRAVPTAEQTVKQHAARLLGMHRRDVPLRDLEQREVRSLSRAEVGRQEASQLHRGLRARARAMSAVASSIGDETLAAVTASLSRTPLPTGPTSLYEALAAIEAMDRLRRAIGSGDTLGSQSSPNVAGLEQTPDGAVITEFYIGFTHDLALMVGPEFEPSGFKFYLSPDTPAQDNSNAVRTIDVPLNDDALIHDTEANTYNVYFGEVDSDLDPSTQYYLWATAYNSDGESIHSNYVYKIIPAGLRGDINGDGVVDMIDVNQMLGILLDGSLPYARADLNQDGENTQEDLDLLIDMVNG